MSIRKYAIADTIVFRKTKEEFGGLSNMASGYSICVNDIVIPSVEHLYQACRFPSYSELQYAIINEPSPMKAKWIGRANINLTRKDWNDVRYKIMLWALKIKLSQNWDSFGSLLASTDSKCIVEESPRDKVWGAVKHEDYYIGINALGRLLMQIRKEYVTSNEYVRCIEPLEIDNFTLLGNDILLVCDESTRCDNEWDLQNHCEYQNKNNHTFTTIY